MSSPPSSEWTDISPSVIQTIETTIQQADKELREISLGIHAHPELGWEEHYAHDALTRFMESKGFEVERHAYGFDTAWRATYEVGEGGRTVGFNSESEYRFPCYGSCEADIVRCQWTPLPVSDTPADIT